MPQKSLEKYGPLRELGPGLWVREGEWRKTIFRRRMTVMQVDGQLAVHSPFILEEVDYQALERLGVVGWILVPNRFHCSDAGAFSKRFPHAKVLSSVAARKALKKQGCKVDGWLPRDWEGHELAAFPLQGTRGLGEILFVHRPSRTLVVTDLVFHILEAPRAIDRIFLKANDILKFFGPSRIFRLLFTVDEHKLIDSLQPVLAEDFDRVVMSHGEVLEKGGKAALIQGFRKRFPRAGQKL